jgi:hypothetical protein
VLIDEVVTQLFLRFVEVQEGKVAGCGDKEKRVEGLVFTIRLNLNVFITCKM